MYCCPLGALGPLSASPSPLGTTRLKNCVFRLLRPVVSGGVLKMLGQRGGSGRGLGWELDSCQPESALELGL